MSFALRQICSIACRAGQEEAVCAQWPQLESNGSLSLSRTPEATWGAAKAFLYDTVADVWGAVRASGEITVEQRIRLRMAGTHAIRQSADAVDIAYNLSGSDAIFASREIQRRFQDAHVITQQIQGREAHYGTAGQFFLGLEPNGVF